MKQDDVMTDLGAFVDPTVKPATELAPSWRIVKVQAHLNGGVAHLVYDERRTFMLLTPSTPELTHLMAGLTKKYFYARFDGPQDTDLTLWDEAPEQPW